jgi:asparagine synthase (glutamine-hydrolysing)
LAKIQKIKSIPLAKELITNKGAYYLIKLISKLKPKWQNYDDKYAKLQKVLSAKGIINSADVINKYFFEDELQTLGILGNINNTSVLNNKYNDNLALAMLMDIKAYLPADILVKVDRATMQVALEGRDPFLDHKIIEYTTQMPYELKIKNNKNKYFLKKILGQYLPEEYFNRPKKGFGIPMYEWFRADLKNIYQNYLNKDKIKKQGIFNADEVQALLNKFLNNEGVQANKLWHLFIFEQWYEKWM